jgi:hypothetical protein
VRTVREPFDQDTWSAGMPSDEAMTGTFKAGLPTDLLSAIDRHDVKGPSKDLTIRAMKPSLVERVIGMLSKPVQPVKRR